MQFCFISTKGIRVGGWYNGWVNAKIALHGFANGYSDKKIWADLSSAHNHHQLYEILYYCLTTLRTTFSA